VAVAPPSARARPHAVFLAEGAGWREALGFEGSRYVGLISRIFQCLPYTDMAPSWQPTLSPRGLIVPGKLYLSYAEDGGPLIMLDGEQVPRRYRVVDPRTGTVVRAGMRASADEGIPDEGGTPRVYICYDEE
jgi:hypothetical protein